MHPPEPTRIPPPGTFRLEVDTSNAAFLPDAAPELAAILEHVAATLPDEDGNYGQPVPIRDHNGNRVGAWCYVPERPDLEAAVLEADTLADAVRQLGWTVEVDAGSHGHDRRDQNPDHQYRPWTWTVRAGAGRTLTGAYWTGPAVTDEPEPLEALAAILLDVDYLEAEAPWVPEGLTVEQVGLILDRHAFLEAAAGSADAFVRLLELAWKVDA